LQADYVTAYENGPITSAKYRLPVTLLRGSVITDPRDCSSRTVSLRQLSFLSFLSRFLHVNFNFWNFFYIYALINFFFDPRPRRGVVVEFVLDVVT